MSRFYSISDKRSAAAISLQTKWFNGFGDDRRHVFALAEAAKAGRANSSDFVSPDAVHSFSSAYPELEAI